MAIDGVSGSGKTFTALRMATALGKKIAVINTESGAVEKYLGLAPDGIPFQFDVCELSDFAPSKYTESILAAGAAHYDVLIIDSLSHAWSGAGGALELKDRKGGNSFTAWKDITPLHNNMIEAILRSPCHVIATMRSKTEYVLETDDRGRQTPKKMGMAPVQRAGMEYEFDVYCSIDAEHIMRVSKSRCPEVADALTVKPGAAFMQPIITWLNDGSEAGPEKFAVNDSDLKKLARVEAADVPPPPKKTTAELMAEAAARVEAPKAEANGSLEITQGQRELIGKLFDDLGITAEQQLEICKKRGVQTLRSFTYEQAGTLIENLEKKIRDRDAAEANPLAGQTVIDTHQPKTASPDQVIAIKAAVSEWAKSQPGVEADFVARLQAAGYKLLSDLSFAEARDLLAAIEAKNMAFFFDHVLLKASA